MTNPDEIRIQMVGCGTTQSSDNWFKTWLQGFHDNDACNQAIWMNHHEITPGIFRSYAKKIPPNRMISKLEEDDD